MIPLILMVTVAGGVPDPTITQANIATTICVIGYTATVRPPSTYTTALKQSQMTALGLPGTTSDYEEDHVIALELGGAPRDPGNLRPQPMGEASKKDTLENKLHKMLCAGTISLNTAQSDMLDWQNAYRAIYGVQP